MTPHFSFMTMVYISPSDYLAWALSSDEIAPSTIRPNDYSNEHQRGVQPILHLPQRPSAASSYHYSGAADFGLGNACPANPSAANATHTSGSA
jgi:hypothetical protein